MATARPRNFAHKLILANIGMYDRAFEEIRNVRARAQTMTKDWFNGLIDKGEEIEDELIDRVEDNQVLTMGEKQIARVSHQARKRTAALAERAHDMLDDVREATHTEELTGKAIRKTAKRVARAVTGDDLTLLKGVGPARAKELHAEGIRTFDELASMTKAQLKTLDDRLNMGGRILRDKWSMQAKHFAKAA